MSSRRDRPGHRAGPDGSLVTVTTIHVLDRCEAFFTRVQECYQRWDPTTSPGFRLPCSAEVRPGWDEVDHCALEATRRANLLACIAKLINEEYGGTITKRYLYELSIAQRAPV